MIGAIGSLGRPGLGRWGRFPAPAVDFPFAATRSLTDIAGGRLATFSRSGGQTITNASGILEIAASGAAAFEHDPLTGECLGVLLEDPRTNALLRSEEYSSPTWVKTRTTISANAIVAPNGTLTGDKLVEDPSAGQHLVFQSITPTASTTHAGSVYAKAAERNVLILLFNFGGLNTSAFLNLSTGVISSITGGGTFTAINAGNGWYRFACVATTLSNTVGNFVSLATPAVGTTSYAGDGTSGIYLWGAQMEVGASPTSYIPTGATSGSRNATLLDLVDAAAVNGIRSFYVESRSPAVGTRGVVSLNDNTANERAELITSGTDPRFVVVDGGTEQATINGGTVSAFTRTRVAVRMQSNGFACSINGGAVSTDNIGTLPTVDRLMLGRTQAGEYLNAPLARFTGWTQELPDTVLQELAR